MEHPEHGAGIVSAAGLSQRSVLDVGSDKAGKVAALIVSVEPKPAAPTPSQVAAQKALTDLQVSSGVVTNASTAVLNATNQVDKYTTALAVATKNNDGQLVALVKSELATANKQLSDSNLALKVAGITLAANSTLVDAKDVATATTLIGNTIAAVQKDADTAKANVASTQAAVAAASAPAGPSALQVATATAAAATAADAAKLAATANSGVQALVATLGSRPTNPDDLTKVNRAMAQSAVTSAQAGLAKAQSDLVALSAKGASNYDIQGQKDLVAKAQANVSYQTLMVANDYAGKRVVADGATTDLASAKAVVDGLTKAYGSNRPADPQQNATITAAMVVQALAQDKADQTAAEVSAARLIAQGASKNDIQVQQDLSATKLKDMAGILKVNPQVLAAAGVAGSTDPALVTKAINGLVSTAAQQSTAAVQQTASAVQQTAAALQQVKTAPAVAPPAVTVTTGNNETATALVTSLRQTSAKLSIQSVGNPVATAPAVSTNTPPAVAVTTAPAAGTTIAPPPVNVGAGVSPELLKNFEAAAGRFTSEPGLVAKLATKLTPTAMQAFINVESGKGMIGSSGPELTKAIPDSRSELAAQGTQPAAKPAATAVVATAAAATAAVAPRGNALAPPAAKTGVAVAPPAATAPSPTALTAPTEKTGFTVDPAKLTKDQSKTVHAALRSIPVDLTGPEQKSFAALAAIVDRAATKGLTPDEALYLKEGLAALAGKHRGEKQAGIATIANTVATAPKPVAGATTQSGTAPLIAATQPAALVTAPVQKPGVATAAPVTTTLPGAPKGPPTAPAQADLKPALASTPPAATVTTPAPKPSVATVTPATTMLPGGPKSAPAAPAPTVVKPVITSTAPAAKVEPPKAVPPPVHAEPARPQPVQAPKAPQVVAPKVQQPALAAAKQVTPAAKPPTCTPNMVNGKQVGMTCH